MTITVSAKLLKCHSETQRRAPACSRARHRVQTSFLARWDSIKVYMYSATHSPRPIIITFADGKEDCNRREEQNSLMQTEEEGMGGRVKAGRQPEIFFRGVWISGGFPLILNGVFCAFLCFYYSPFTGTESFRGGLNRENHPLNTPRQVGNHCKCLHGRPLIICN